MLVRLSAESMNFFTFFILMIASHNLFLYLLDLSQEWVVKWYVKLRMSKDIRLHLESWISFECFCYYKSNSTEFNQLVGATLVSIGK